MSTCVKIASVTVGAGGAASIDFSSIPQTFDDLKILVSLRSPSDNAGMKINGSTTGYSAKMIQGNGASASSYSKATADETVMAENSAFTANVFSSGEIYIPNYTSANYKTYSIESLEENNATTAYITLTAYLWANVAAITSLSFYLVSAQVIDQYSSVTLYGIKNS